VTANRLRLGIVNAETWDFLRDLHPVLAGKYATDIFSPPEVRTPVFRERLARSLLKRGLKRFLERHDVVFFEWASGLLAAATHLPKACAIVTRLHRYEMYAWADRINWDAVDEIILVSEAKRREFVARFPAHAGKTAVVPVGVCAETFRYVPRPFSGSLGTLCHVSPRKRVYDLILALSGCLRECPRLHLSIGGDVEPAYGDYRAALVRLVDRLGLTAQVGFEGRVHQPCLWYQKIDVFISHSYSEGLQVAPIEAMATGCYTLSHHWDGADELMPEDCLYLTDDELVVKVRAFCRATDAARERERHRMRSLVLQRFAADAVGERVAGIIERAAGRRCRTVHGDH